MSRQILSMVAGAAIVCGASLVSADDIDLYVGGEQITGAASNVLIILDNSTNWAANNQGWPSGKQGESELQAMSEVIGTLGDNINLGLLMASNANGGYVRYAIREMNVTNRPVYQGMLDTMRSTFGNDGNNNDKINTASLTYDNMMNSAYRYFQGLDRWLDDPSPHTDMRDYNGNNNNVAYTNNLGNYSLAGASTNPYLPPPQAADGCAKNFIIFIGNGYPNQGAPVSDISDTAALAGVTLAADGSDLANVPGGDNSRSSDEWTRFMHKYGVRSTVDDPANPGTKLRNKIVTYTIDVCKDACEVNQEKLLRSMANQGQGKYFKSTSQSEIKSALRQIFAEIQAVNSVFASASLPVSVNTQGTYENQVYIGMFRPDGNARPRWFGNLKEYKFARHCDYNNDGLVQDEEKIADSVTDTSSCSRGVQLYLADRDNRPAIDQTRGTGFVDLYAVSYWTTEQNPGFWSFYSDPIAGTDDKPDGPLVERGGAAFRLRNQFSAGRNVYTCLGACLTPAGQPGAALSAQSFVDTNSTVTALLTPSGSKTVTLSRTGNDFTATSSGAHGFNDGDSITISGATPPDYNVSGVTISTAGPASSTFTYTIPNFEKPNDDMSGGARVSTSAINTGVTELRVDETALTATATTVSDLSFGVGDTLTIKNASQSFLNVVNVTPSSSGVSTVTYAITLPPQPVAATTVGTTGHGGSSAVANSSITFQQESGTNYRLGVVVLSGNNRTNTGWSIGDSITIAGAAPSDYNGIWSVYKLGLNCPGVSNGNKNNAYCFRLVKTPDAGVGIAATKVVASQPIVITRMVGSTRAYGRLASGGHHGFNGTSATIFGSTQNAYNNAWTLYRDTVTTFYFEPVPVSPAAPTGTATATPSAASGQAVGTANLIKWVRGMDVYEDENQNGSKTDVRASIHGDVLHSRPVVLSYGSAIGVVGYYGSNDGMLHAVKGGIADTDGVEKWAFIPEEFVNYTKLSRLYLNEPLIKYPTLQCGISPTPTQRDYFWDGSMVAYQTPDGTADTAPTKSWLFATMRRGGRSIYAFDVTDPDTPKFKWRVNSTMDDFSALQQTWSTPRIVKVKGMVTGAAVTKQALVFGSGYASAEEDKPAGTVRNALSHSGVYVVDADTGSRLAFVEPPDGVTKYSFAADVSVVDMDGDGHIDRIYAADTGGNIFRFDADQTQAPGTAWTSYIIAKLGDTAGDGGPDDRKFLFPPSLLPFLDPTTKKVGVNILVGSGDREQPLKHPVSPTCASYYGGSASLGVAIQDRFYSVLDMVQTGADRTEVNAASIVEGDLLEVNADPNALASYNISQLNATSPKKGWYITLKNNVDSTTTIDEEKTVNAPRVIAGVAYFGTNTPQRPDISHGICSSLGQALGYAVDPFTGLPAFNRDGSSNGLAKGYNYATVFSGGGLPPTVTSGVVMIGGQPYFAIIGSGGSGGGASGLGGSKDSPVGQGDGQPGCQGSLCGGVPPGCSGALCGGKVLENVPSTRTKIYWRYKKD